MKLADISTQLDTCVTCIQTGLGDNRHVAGVSFGDGHVKVITITIIIIITLNT